MTDPPRGGPAGPAPSSTQRPGAEAALSIGELAREFEISTRTIRFYETRGLITPRRNGLNRTFGPADRHRLALIVRAKNLGLSLEEIGEHLALHDAASAPPTELKSLKLRADRHIAALIAKRTDLAQTLRELKQISAGLAARLTRARRSER